DRPSVVDGVKRRLGIVLDTMEALTKQASRLGDSVLDLAKHKCLDDPRRPAHQPALVLPFAQPERVARSADAQRAEVCQVLFTELDCLYYRQHCRAVRPYPTIHEDAATRNFVTREICWSGGGG